MEISARANAVKESVTLKLNEKVVSMSESGKKVFNLTAGQLPFRPMPELVEGIGKEFAFLKSFQYTAVPGVVELRKKVINYIEESRGVRFRDLGIEVDCVVSNGAKHSIYNILGALIDPEDEVIILSPYWISYPEMIRCWGGIPVEVASSKFESYIPAVEEIEKSITKKTRAIIVNSPNNPSGISYPKSWMKNFANLLLKHPHLSIVSDEIYFELSYFDPKPTYFYQFEPSLLKRTIIVDGISKSLACTGLRVGYSVGPKNFLAAVEKIQAQTTSGANSLIQRSLVTFDFALMEKFLSPIRVHLRNNANVIRKIFEENALQSSWYQVNSAFYFLVDFQSTPVFKRYLKNDSINHALKDDFSVAICSDLLERKGVAIVPGSDFGIANSGRLSLVLEEKPFLESIKLLAEFMVGE
ncbi:MAG: aminotransferase class I/II-fold pyridoxal phosphate-dependent enzyme [Oligoflexia bacterium]|nr:aminotransferase class I/II-fold pyridoxal phosphate-dependent enzyme [Oligoflexia bacterium]MBF0367360.1 aminotransferase class I/II-fold pyridoxal phosphate-dependent enzyme [Oligoflexia bacterium]